MCCYAWQKVEFTTNAILIMVAIKTRSTDIISGSAQRFLLCESGNELAEFFNVKYSSLVYHLNKIPDEKKYKTFTIAKKNGGVREICAPISPIKILQTNLSKVLYELHKPKSSSYGFVKNRDITSNARVHARKRYVLNIDLKDFFTSINFGRVFGAFKSYPFNFNQNVAAFIANICCYKNVLPQGSPSSPIVSDIISVTLDKQLIKFANENRLKYTRYADDITFSSNMRKSFGNAISILNNQVNISAELESIIQSCGFNINNDKVRFRTNKSQRVEVTGLTVNKFPNVKRVYIRNKIIAVLNAIDKYGIEKAQQEFNKKFDEKQRLGNHPDLFKVVRGRIGFLKHVLKKRPEKYRPVLRIDEIEKKYKDLLERERIFRRIESEGNGYDAIIITEGKTDWMHLKAAFRRLNKKGKYETLNIKYYEYNHNMGNTSLEKFCKQSQKRLTEVNIICVFDSDVPSTNKSVNSDDGLPRRWSNNLFSFSTPLPSHRKHLSEGSIEFFYTNTELLTFDQKGCRLIFNEELKVKKDKGYVIDSLPDITKFESKKILDDKVGQVINSSGQKIGLTKNEFATNVLEGAKGFEDFSTEQFELIFSLINKLCDDFKSND